MASESSELGKRMTLEKAGSQALHRKRLDLLACLSEAEIEELSQFSETLVVERGQPIYRAGENSDRIFLLKAGSVKLSRVSHDGRGITLAVLGPMDVFGELAIAGEELRQEAAEALEEVVVCAFEQRPFEHFLVQHPTLALRLVKLIGARLRRVEIKIQDLLFKDVRARLAHTLAQLAERFGEAMPGGTRIGMHLTQTDLAQLIGSTRETTSTIFNEFRRGRLVDHDGTYIIVREAETLEGY
ncbi:MAG: Crp/Fnr family transcriptional regulator [Acidobacteriota bacterium]